VDQRAFVAAAFLLAAAACTSSAPTSSTQNSSSNTSQTTLPPLTQAVTVSFSGLTTNGAAVTTYTESGITITVSGGPWTATTTYGNPAPFLGFLAAAGTTVTGTVSITGRTFNMRSVDLYSSTTPIPYAISGLRGTSQTFSSSATLDAVGVVGNTFGNFRTVTNPNATTAVDGLTITLTNPAAACCSNPMGLDNIVLVPPGQ